MAYIGTQPNEDIVVNVHEYVATDGQTNFDAVYDNYVEVYLNGWQLDSSAFTAVDGTHIVLSQGASDGDVVVVKGYETYRYNDTVDKSTAQTITGRKTFSQPVKAADAVNDDELVTKGQVNSIIITYTESATEPDLNTAKLGDEWWDTANSMLYKCVTASGAKTWLQIA